MEEFRKSCPLLNFASIWQIYFLSSTEKRVTDNFFGRLIIQRLSWTMAVKQMMNEQAEFAGLNISNR